MWFQSRTVLTGAVAALIVAGTGVGIMAPSAPDSTVAVPQFAPAAAVDVPAQPQATPLITGGQLARIAVAPARDRITVLAEKEAAARAARERARTAVARSGEESGDGDWDQLSSGIREACAEGRLKGKICKD